MSNNKHQDNYLSTVIFVGLPTLPCFTAFVFYKLFHLIKRATNKLDNAIWWLSSGAGAYLSFKFLQIIMVFDAIRRAFFYVFTKCFCNSWVQISHIRKFYWSSFEHCYTSRGL